MLSSSHFQAAAVLLRCRYYNRNSVRQNQHMHKLKTTAPLRFQLITCKMITQRDSWKLIPVSVSRMGCRDTGLPTSLGLSLGSLLGAPVKESPKGLKSR